MIPRREGDNPAMPLLFRQLEQAVRGSAKLERVTSLEALAFQPDWGAPDLATDERRLLYETGNAIAGRDHIISGDRRRFS